MHILCLLVVSMLSSYGASVLLVEKRFVFPVKWINVRLRQLIHRFSPKWKGVLHCATCTSFWMPLVMDAVICVATGFKYWLWPLSGFATAGLTWFVFEVLSVLENRKA